MNLASPSPAAHDPDRWLKARLDLLIAPLPVAAIVNPIFAALFVMPFGGALPAFGVLSWQLLLAIVVIHCATSGLALVIHAWANMRKPPPRQLLTTLLVFQVIAGSTWGLTAFLCWIEGNDANNTLVALIIIANMWALVLTRGYLASMFAVGLGTLLTSIWALSFVSDGQAATLFVFIAPIFAAYAWLLGTSSRERVDQLFATRFALEDMAVVLKAKSQEAAAASASKSAFVANMSHELRTPLNAILGFSEIIERAAVGAEISQQYRSYGRDIHRSGAHLLSLINDMLDVAKIEAGKMELNCHELDGESAIESAVTLVAHRAEQKSQTLAVRVQPGLKPFADERAFKQILINLLSNAVKFSPEGGALELSCEQTAGGGVTLAVSDSGPGIPNDKINELFRPFARADNSYGRSTGGTGLGLALVLGLVNLHGGKVWLENKPQGGLRACVELPGRALRAVA
jgi:two-component system cell cycle sensor histidine kinase PleC